MSRLLTSIVVLGVVGAISAPSALAADCGDPASRGADPTVGALELDTKDTQNNPLNFKGTTGRKSFRLVYDVKGCTLRSAAGLSATVHADSDVAKAFAHPSLEPRGSVLLVDIDVRPVFPTGSADALLTVSGDPVGTMVQPLTVQRKTPPTGPLLVIVLAGLLGVGMAYFKAYVAARDKADHEKKKLGWSAPHGLVGVGAGLLALGAVYESAYYKPETFSLDVPTVISLSIAASAAAAGGAKAGVGFVSVLNKRASRSA